MEQDQAERDVMGVVGREHTCTYHLLASFMPEAITDLAM